MDSFAFYCRIPIWYHIKLAFVAWLVLPQFRGASFIYERFVRQQIRNYGIKLGKDDDDAQHTHAS
jgi:receptor expression-enhancing protein 5/6